MQFYTQVLTDSHFVCEEQNERGCRQQRSAYNPMILYCCLAGYSALQNGGVFTFEDSFNIEKLRELEGSWVQLRNMPKSKICDETNMSKRDIYNALAYLKERGLVNDGEIQIIDGLFSNQYFELQPSCVLKGTALIVYSYVIRRYELLTNRYGEGDIKSIDTWTKSLAKGLGMSYHTVTHALHRCEREGCLKRIYQGTGASRRPILQVTAPIFKK